MIVYTYLDARIVYTEGLSIVILDIQHFNKKLQAQVIKSTELELIYSATVHLLPLLPAQR